MKVPSERGSEALYIGSVYIPTDCTSISAEDTCYKRLKKYVLT